MAEPRIQYVQTQDGANIAYWTLGEGEPLVHMPFMIGHIQMEWEYEECREWYRRLSEHRMLVRYDHRGQGLSDRDRRDHSVDTYVQELEAVVDRLGVERVALVGLALTGPIAIAYAARHPERVSHLILWCTVASPSEWAESPQVQASRALLDQDWTIYTETLANVVLGWSEGEPARHYSELVREAVTPDVLKAAIRSSGSWQTSDLLSRVKSPTLVIQRSHVPPPGVDAARRLSAGIPDARLALLDGTSLAPYLGNAEAVLRAIDEFLGNSERPAAEAKSPEAGAFRTVLFTDMEGSTTLTQKLGDAKAQEVLRTHNSIVRDALTAHSGTETKHTGDGIMASFTSASAALEAAVSIQKALAEHNEGNPDAAIRVRIGLNAGEPVAEDEDLFGTAVQLAARVCDKAEPGQILASNVVQELAAGKGFTFVDNGEATLKGFEKAVRLHEVRWHD